MDLREREKMKANQKQDTAKCNALWQLASTKQIGSMYICICVSMFVGHQREL